ncbi:outer membrane beta-barrel family protein [Pedobacter sp. MC2016-05]|uniref:outer membrane beta-barrel family protein n=1 Tax=Pedobacter sp. MC2016-05 TaxID=2994474 RepID=UPI00224717E1|nr:outer membrane beta-barrel family protein [Pedobacter sp. MC2016-05]MCX2475460.1 outer membrane beta-barrel family protein [Pedobacter sp. MC2016-05]
MKRLLLLLCGFVLINFSANAQGLHSVKGRTIDTASTTLLAGSTIAILNSKDSTLVKFTRSAENGSFELNGIKNGKFILLVSYPKYADFVDHFTLDSTTQVKDYGKINLTGMAKILADVIIKGNRNAIKIKGDTTEFDPKAFNIEPNSKVEDLIKQFPGIQVDKDGKITAQGKTVQKVLVDGEEFFGDDPTLVTKNLRADMVESVQLYDKASDQASFTGIDDGEKTKTLNVKLKEDKKNGYFGKVQGGYGTDDFYNGQFMFNKFWGKKKFSAYGILGNNGTVGLGWDDRDKYGGSSGMTMTDDGGMYFSSGGSDDFDSYDGQYNGQGIPVARTGGLHFDSKWNKDKESLNTNYKIGSIRVKGDRNTISQNNLSSGVINNVSDQYTDNDMFRQKLDATYEVKLDSTLTLKVNVDGTLKQSNTFNDYNTSSTDGNNDLLNTTKRTLKNKVDEQMFNINGLLTKRFQKKGRTLSLNLNQSITKSNSDGYLNSENSFYEITGRRDSLINQYKVNDITNSAFKSNLAYTEPLSKTMTVIVNYGLSLMNGKSDRKSFNQSASGNYDILDTEFSNDYQLDQIINQGGAIFNYKKGKTIINFGSKFSGVNFKQTDLYNNKTYDRNFVNYMPQASYQYRFSQQKSFRISYNGNTNQPSLDQIQPVRVNTDPLNISLGNPDLRPSFRSNINANYNSYKVLTNQSIWLSGSYSFTANPIVSDVTTDALTGRSSYRSVNITDKMSKSFSVYAQSSRKISGIDLNAGINLSTNGNSSYNYINKELNNTKNYTYNLGIDLNKYVEKKYNFYINVGPTYNVSRASIGNFGNSDGWGWNGYSSGSVQLPGKFSLSTDAQYEFRGKTQTFNETFSRFLWNASLTKKFLKSENLKLMMSVNDILNQNVGFDRTAYNGNITQSSYTTIMRYFMFSVIWDFNKMGGGLKTSK